MERKDSVEASKANPAAAEMSLLIEAVNMGERSEK